MITVTDILTQSKNILSYPSSIRDGQVRKLRLGEVAIFDYPEPTSLIVSTKRSSEASFRRGRVYVETFIISKNFEVDPKGKITDLDKIKSEFSRHEVSEVMKRIKGVDDVILADNLEIKRLQKFFDDVGKKVVVLSDGKIAELDSNFTLLVRSDASLETATDEATGKMQLVMWEDVGFIYEITR